MRRPVDSVLVVDEAGAVDALAARLRDDGLAVLVAVGAEARELAREGVEVVVAPVDSGAGPATALLRAARERDPDAQLVVSASPAQHAAAIAALREGASDVLARPLDAAVVAGAVHAALERHRQRTARGLREAGDALLVLREPQKILDAVTAIAARELAADGVHVLLAGPGGALRLAATSGSWGGSAPPTADAIARLRGAAGDEPGEPVLLSRSLDAELLAGVPGAPSSLLLLPLARAGRLVGLLTAGRREGRPPFEAPELSRAGILAAQMALALENARLVEEMLSSARLTSLGALLGGVAHQLNNPITALVSAVRYASDGLAQIDALEALCEEPDGAQRLAAWWRAQGRRDVGELKAALADALESADRLRDLAKDLRAVVRADPGASTFDLGEAVSAALRLAGSDVWVAAQVEVDAEPGAWVVGSIGRLAQVFMHLLANAAHALAAAGRRGHVRVRVAREGPWAVAEVADDGPGIPPGDLERIWDPFFSTRAEGGIGLGLPLCREIVARHRGEIVVRSAPGRGTTVTLRLPAVAGR